VIFGHAHKLMRIEANHDTYDCYVSEHAPLFECEEWIFPHGDGHLIRIRSLPPSVRDRFSRFDSVLASLPVAPSSDRFPWNAVTWKRSPLQEQHKELLSSSMTVCCKEHKDLCLQYLAQIDSALSKPGSFYACTYRQHSGNITDADFYIIDLPNNRLIKLMFGT
jgi:hypothetical protein